MSRFQQVQAVLQYAPDSAEVERLVEAKVVVEATALQEGLGSVGLAPVA
jgi:hypothetical protein